MKMVCESIHLCAGIVSRIEETTHAVVQRRHERHVTEPGGGADAGSEGAEDNIVAATSGTERAGEEVRFGGIGEVSRPPGEWRTVKEGERGEGRASNYIRTVMVEMEVGREEMDEGEEDEVEKDVAEVEEGGLGGGCWYWKPQGDTDSVC